MSLIKFLFYHCSFNIQAPFLGRVAGGQSAAEGNVCGPLTRRKVFSPLQNTQSYAWLLKNISP